MKKQISFSIAIIIIVICVILVGGVAVWWYLEIPAKTEFLEIGMPPDETANWKTYKNEELGFEFKYPPNLNFVTDITSSTEKINNKIKLDISFSTSPTIYIQEKTSDQYLSLILIINLADKNYSEQNSEPCPESEKEIILGEIKGCKRMEIREFSEGSGGFNPHNLWNGYFNAKDDKYEYSFYFYYLAGLEVINAEDIFNQILSTFRFLE